MSGELAPFIPALQFMYNAVGFADYQQILDTIDGYPLTEEQKADLRIKFPRPGCAAPAEWEVADEGEDFTEAYATDPRDPGPLSEYQNHGWVDDADPDTFRENPFYEQVRRRAGIDDLQVLDDIRENTLHILGRCNNPNDWGENRQGLVYGMVQSGKTASMINLISMGIVAGYKLFIILAGDKDSLRKQTQKRVNDAFGLTNGANTATRIHSPTFLNDFKKTGFDYRGTFKTQYMQRGEQYSTIIVMKKEGNHLEHLIRQIGALGDFCSRSGGRFSLEDDFPALILDDEADYASLDTNPLGSPSPIHADLIELRESLPRNCYAAYTATPQGCLSSNPNDPVGYPKDFFWLLEPFVEEVNGRDVTRSYLGAWDVFWEYDEYLIERIGRNEWPHYESDVDGRHLGIWYPGRGDGDEGHYEQERTNDEAQRAYLESICDGSTPIPASLVSSLVDFVIGAGVRWWDHWKKNGQTDDLPGLNEVSKTYPHHAIMIHLSRLLEHQILSRRIVEIAWEEMKGEWNEFDVDDPSRDNLFSERWADQRYRTSRLKPERSHMPFDQVRYFIEFAIEISEQPIREDVLPYNTYPGAPFSYLVNSGESGMRLYYDDDDPWEIKTKRAAIIVGGQILSRGLTIEGLSVSFFGRTARMPMGDTVLQMGRWFGHKKSYIDLISIYMQDGLRVLFRHIAEADRYLRVQIKDAIFRDLRPDQILIELRNSPQFRATSPTKSRFVNFGNSSGFSGRRALLREPTFTKAAIKHNNDRFRRFELQYRSRAELVHNRAKMYRDVPAHAVVSLLSELRCRNTATQDSYSDYARFLSDWLEGENHPPLPKVNIAVRTGHESKRKRELSISKPQTSEQARSAITGRFASVVGGRIPHGDFRGDYFLDKDEQWHKDNQDARGSDPRIYGKDDILLVFYRLQPNYVTSKLFDPEDTDQENPLGRWRSELVVLQPGDRFYVEVPEGEEESYPVIVFAAFTPRGGPQYGVGVNTMLDSSNIVQRGLRNFEDEANMEDGP